ncbi:MAG TPA: GGDEF domain-containing protein [Pseudomonadales bacterium]|nr:GGDEF domain-containing protein [Pseudomonadales bacterium]
MRTSRSPWLTLDHWLPGYFRETEDQWEAMQARVLTLLLLLYGVGFIPVCIAATAAIMFGILNTAIPAMITASGSVAALACLYQFRRTANLDLTSRLYAWMALAMILAIIMYTGGWESPVCVFLLTLPIIAGFAMEQKSRLNYAFSGWLLYTVLFFLHRSGYVSVQLIPHALLPFAQALVWTSALVASASCLILFEISESRLSSVLARDTEELERQVLEDDLTGALNDQALLARMEEQTNIPGSAAVQRVVYLVVNNYRDIARFFGYESADAFLSETARHIRQIAGNAVVMGRNGTHEFVLYAPDSSINNMQFSRMLDKFRALDNKGLSLPDNKRFLLDLDIGVSTTTDHTLSPGALIDLARTNLERRTDDEI